MRKGHLLIYSFCWISFSCQFPANNNSETTPIEEPTTLVEEAPLTTQEQDVQTIESIKAYVQQVREQKEQLKAVEPKQDFQVLNYLDAQDNVVYQEAKFDAVTLELYARPTRSMTYEVCYVQYHDPNRASGYYGFYNLSPTGYVTKVIVMDQDGLVLMGEEEAVLLRQYEQYLLELRGAIGRVAN